MLAQEIRQRIEGATAPFSMLDHPFYRDWVDGKLSATTLQYYAEQYHHFVHAFPTFVSAVHSRCDDLEVRKMLLENLIEEERGDQHHPELWLRFADRLGADRDRVAASEPHPATRALVDTFKAQCRDERPALGLATLYAYESQVPQVSETKIAGLKEHFGFDGPEGLEFFEVHREADVLHSAQEIEAIGKVAEDEGEVAEAVAAAGRAARALWGFLDGVVEATTQANKFWKNLPLRGRLFMQVLVAIPVLLRKIT